MGPSSVDIKAMLEAYGESSGIGVDFSTDVFIGIEPEMPHNCISIFDVGGYPPALSFTDQGYEYPTLQIRVRNLNYVAGWTIAEEIKQALHGQAQVTWNGVLYSLIMCTNGPALLDYDEKNRPRFYLNFNVQRRTV